MSLVSKATAEATVTRLEDKNRRREGEDCEGEGGMACREEKGGRGWEEAGGLGGQDEGIG